MCCLGVLKTTLRFDDSLEGLTELGTALSLRVPVYYREGYRFK